MREVGIHVAEILLMMREIAKPGCHDGRARRARAMRQIERRGVTSSFLDYGPGGLPPYPGVICASVNEEIVHGIPGPRVLEDGDLLSIDFGVELNGVHGDSACTIPVGEISAKRQSGSARRTEASLYKGIEQMVPGKRLSDIGHAMQKHAESRRLLGRASVRRPRHRLPDARAAADPELRAPRPRARACCRAWSSRSSPW